MNKTWMPIAAGILDIISGLFLLTSITYAIIRTVFNGTPAGSQSYFLTFLHVIIPIIVALASVGIIAIVGGVYLMKKEKWGLVYLGALAAFVSVTMPVLFLFVGYHPAWALILLIGIAALVLSLRAEKEFKK